MLTSKSLLESYQSLHPNIRLYVSIIMVAEKSVLYKYLHHDILTIRVRKGELMIK